jgi:hypothetical protein
MPSIIIQIERRRRIQVQQPHPVVIIKALAINLIHQLGLHRVLFRYPYLDEWGKTTKGTKDALQINRLFLLGLTVLSTAALAMVYSPPGHRLIVAFIVLQTISTSGFIPTQLVADRYSNVSTIFLMYLLASYAPLVSVPLLALYAMRTHRLLPMYRNISSFISHHPDFTRMQHIAKHYGVPRETFDK